MHSVCCRVFHDRFGSERLQRVRDRLLWDVYHSQHERMHGMHSGIHDSQCKLDHICSLQHLRRGLLRRSRHAEQQRMQLVRSGILHNQRGIRFIWRLQRVRQRILRQHRSVLRRRHPLQPQWSERAGNLRHYVVSVQQQHILLSDDVLANEHSGLRHIDLLRMLNGIL